MNRLSIFLVCFGMLLMQSCNNDDENMDPIVEWTLSTPGLTSPEDNASIFLDVEQSAQEFEFAWSAASSSAGFNVNYVFYMSTSDDPGFDSPVFFEELSETFRVFNAQELDALLEGAGIEAGVASDLIWAVKAVSLDKESITPARDVSITRFEEIEVEINALYLLSNGAVVAELLLDGTEYVSNGYLALEESVVYTLNTEEDGSGLSYSAFIGDTPTPDADNVSGSAEIGQGGDITVARDQMYQVTVDVDALSLDWQYYNLKLFHWDEDGGGWDSRNEYVMTYVHPYKFTVTGELQFNFHSKFNSPWDVQFGADLPSALVGTMTNNGGANFDNIVQDGLYKADIELASDYSTGTYEFIIQ